MMAVHRMLILSVVIVIAVPAGTIVVHKRDVASATFHLMNRGAYLSDDNGLLNDRAPPWGSLRDVMFTRVRHLVFISDTRRLRFSRIYPSANPSLSDPTPEEMIRLKDADFASIARLTSLVYLDLQDTDISDDSLRHLESLAGLRALVLGVNVTRDGVERLHRSLPNCVINY